MTTRFRRREYAGKNTKGDVPRWHVAAHPYRKGELYNAYEALCGYTIKTPWLRTEAQLSVAKTVRGPVCSKCEKKAKELL